MGSGRSVIAATTPFTGRVAIGLSQILSVSTHVYGIGQIGMGDARGNAYYFRRDGLGSVRAVTDGSGNVVATYDYDAYGNLRSSTGTLANAIRYTGEYRDAETGFYYLRARYYDPVVGRFITRDPFKGTLTRPYSQNPYLYVENDPVNRVDPSGLFPPSAEEIIEQILNATATPVYAPDETGQRSDLADLVAYGEACRTGAALPYIDTATDALIVVGMLVPGGGELNAAANGPRIAGTLRGFTQHGIDQVISRGVRPYEILDTLRSPVRVLSGRGNVVRYVGRWAELRINAAGKVVTAIRFKAPNAP